MTTEKNIKELHNLRDEAQVKIDYLSDDSKKFELQQKLDRISDDIDEAIRDNDDYGLEKLKKELANFVFIEVGNPTELLVKICSYPRQD